MQTLSFVPKNLHSCWPRELKHSIMNLPTQQLFSVKKIFPYLGEEPVSNDCFYCLSTKIKYMFISTLVFGMHVCLNRCIRVSET